MTSADEDEEPEDAGPAPEDAARRWVTSMSFRDFHNVAHPPSSFRVMACTIACFIIVSESYLWSLQMKVDTVEH